MHRKQRKVIQDRQCTYNITLRSFRESLLPWKSSYLLLCVCVCVGARALVWVPGRLGVCMRVRACSLAFPSFNTHAPCCDVMCVSSGSTIFFNIIS